MLYDYGISLGSYNTDMGRSFASDPGINLDQLLDCANSARQVETMSLWGAS